MPNRMIRESCRTSPTLDELSDGAERTFWRLTTVADDYGRFEADPRVVLSACYPLRAGRLDVGQVEAWLKEMVSVGLVLLYRVGQKLYGVFVSWAKHQQIRAKRSKYPEPPASDSICQQTLANVPVVEVVVESRSRESRVEVENTTFPPPAGAGGPGEPDDAYDPKHPAIKAVWESYSAAYAARYGEKPVRNAPVNAAMKAFIRRVPREEAAAIAAFYVASNFGYYVREAHPVWLLNKHAEKLRTEWATGRRVTETQAKQADQRQHRGGVATRLLDKARAQEAARHAQP